MAAEAHLSEARLLLPHASSSVRAAFVLEDVRQAMQFRPWAVADLLNDLDTSAAATVLRVQAALDSEDPRGAVELLASLSPPATPREHVERGVLGALVERDLEPAHGHLAAALTVARPDHYLRTIIGLGPRVPKLLSSFPPDRALEGYVATLIDAVSAVVAPSRRRVATPLVEPLSSRELSVLRYLSSRLTNQEIASALYVSLNTLKSHVKSIYRKLSVSSRAEAVEAGRRLRLI